MLDRPHSSPWDVHSLLVELQQQQVKHPEFNLVQFDSLISAHQYLRLYTLIDRWVPVGSQVLDWGCGSGHFVYFLLRRGYKAYGYGFLGLDQVGLLRSIQPQVHYQQGDPAEPTRLPYADAQFGAVTSVGVLEHVRETGGNELASLQEIVRILKPGGHFICYHLPNALSAIEQLSSRLPNKYHHRYRYTRSTIEQLCQQAGLELLTCQRYGVLPRNVWNAAPPSLKNARWLAQLWDGLDNLARYPASIVCQNYCFVAQKPLNQPSATHTNSI